MIFAGRPQRSAGEALISNAPRGPSCRIVIDRVELPVSDRLKRRTMKSVAWFKIRRLLGPLRDRPSAEFEEQYYRIVSASAEPELK